MNIEFDPLDLKLQYQKDTPQGKNQAVRTREITYHHLNPTAKAVLREARRGVFYAWDRQTYNAVFWTPGM